MNNTCSICIMDCDQYTQNEICENFKEAQSIAEYNRIIKEQNRNLHRCCEIYNLKYSELMKMLRYKTRMKFRYRKCLEEFLFSKRSEWDKWELEGSKTYE